MAIKTRVSRTIREARRRRLREPRQARSVKLDRRGLIVDGKRLPWLVSTEVHVTTVADTAHIVRLGIFTEAFEVLSAPRGATITHTYE